MKKSIVCCVAVLSLALSGCAGKMMENGLSTLTNQGDINVAFNVLGAPSGKLDLNDQLEVYTWEYNNNWGNYCTIRLTVNKASKSINQYDYRGNEDGCWPYAQRLDAYYKSKTAK